MREIGGVLGGTQAARHLFRQLHPGRARVLGPFQNAVHPCLRNADDPWPQPLAASRGVDRRSGTAASNCLALCVRVE
jgi:hypothetical protein